MFGMVLVDGMISVANACTLRLSAVSLLRAWVFGIVVCAMRHIVLPQALGIHIAPIPGQAIVLVKDSDLLSLIRCITRRGPIQRSEFTVDDRGVHDRKSKLKRANSGACPGLRSGIRACLKLVFMRASFHAAEDMGSLKKNPSCELKLWDRYFNSYPVHPWKCSPGGRLAILKSCSV